MSREQLEAMRERVGKELDRTMDFWLKHSHDTECGGFFTCLSQDGSCYDDLKYIWLQGRQVWTYCHLYRNVERFHTPEILNAAIKGGAFLLSHARVSPGSRKCAFVVRRGGAAVKVQRSMFSECFYVLAMDELWRVTGEERYKTEARQMMDQIVLWVRSDPSELGHTPLPGCPPISSLAVPMMLLCLTLQLEDGAKTPSSQPPESSLAETGAWCVQRILRHVQCGGTAVLENVSMSGEMLPGSEGRLLNPGHALEAGWFLLTYADRRGDDRLRSTAVDHFLFAPFQRGWDSRWGGLYYFLDVDGLSPTQLDWDRKLWWPHCEGLVGFLLGYQMTRDPRLFQHFETLFNYTFSHFPDPEFGEWFGYLSRDGNVSQTFKGGPFKGCFHLPRCLYLCEMMLNKLLKDAET